MPFHFSIPDWYHCPGDVMADALGENGASRTWRQHTTLMKLGYESLTVNVSSQEIADCLNSVILEMYPDALMTCKQCNFRCKVWFRNEECRTMFLLRWRSLTNCEI